jgi:hypothetical protein
MNTIRKVRGVDATAQNSRLKSSDTPMALLPTYGLLVVTKLNKYSELKKHVY